MFRASCSVLEFFSVFSHPPPFFIITLFIINVFIAQNDHCSLDIYLQCIDFLRSVNSPTCIIKNASGQVLLVKINSCYSPLGINSPLRIRPCSLT